MQFDTNGFGHPAVFADRIDHDLTPGRKVKNLCASRTALGVVGVLSAGVALFSYRYLLNVGFRPPTILANLFAKLWLNVHIAGAATALLIGPLNYVGIIRRRFPMAHRWIGRTYICSCLLGAVGGAVIAFGTFAGPIAVSGFFLLDACWIVANLQGWRMARARRFGGHRAWMIRSFAMTFGAVNLRVYLQLAMLLHLPFLESYRVITFLAWMPNLLLAEIYIRYTASTRDVRKPLTPASPYVD